MAMKMFRVVRRTCRNAKESCKNFGSFAQDGGLGSELILVVPTNFTLIMDMRIRHPKCTAGWGVVGVSHLCIASFTYLICSKSKANAHIADEAQNDD